MQKASKTSVIAGWAAAIGLVIVVETLRVAGLMSGHTYWATGLDVELAVAFTSLGAVILLRSNERRMGRLFFFIGCAAAFGLLCGQLALTVPAHRVVAAVLVGAAEFERYVDFIGLIYLLMVFPTGEVLTPRWRWPARLAWLAVPFLTAETILRPGQFDLMPGVINPLHGTTALSVLSRMIGGPLLLVGIIAAVATLIVRYRRAHTAQRQQIKLFVLSAVGCVAFIAVMNVLFPTQMDKTSLGDYVWDSPGIILPVVATFAILRHGLFDIDRIISRTLSYTVVTAVLVGSYIGLVVVFESITRPITGRSDLAVAASTLIAAALFVPLRSRVQSAVDHRFNRRRYDAERTIQSFSGRLRAEVDIETLRTDLERIVRDTMHPAHVSLWITPARRREGSSG